ncbi:D-alanine--D-serine ligase VanG [Cytobacillus gottheilii]|uniref:D-alanine--D-serine ligase VanG n=1 Tax=Cytobacillus gottheilii TaxID=859144 RepID=UPI0009BBE3E5|nr:D-alanine--D-serine ligase VanG [Cytobacillus gottheilii]
MEKMIVAVLFGGCSNEYEVSLQSAYSVITHMDPEKYEVVLIGITKEGRWYRYHGRAENILNDTWYADEANCTPAIFSPNRYENHLLEEANGQVVKTMIDLVFPVLHGKNGEDGTLQGYLELAGIPYVGCNTLSSALCMDKDRAHKLAALEGVRTPASVVFSKSGLIEEIIAETDQLKLPLFVKPVKSGSSIGITLVNERDELPSAVAEAFSHDDRVIIEEFIDGFEVGCAILGNDDLIVGEVDEIELETGYFDFKEKYSLTTSKIHMPARIDEDLKAKVKDTGIKIYHALGCSGLARVDMFITPSGEIVFNEVNTFPGFTDHSRYPNMMKGIGLTFSEIIDTLIQLGLER